MIRAFKIGDNHRYRGRVKMAMHNKFGHIPVLRGADKNHKDGFDPAVGPPLRPIVAADEAPNGQIAEFATQVFQAVALKIDETQGTMCLSTEEMKNKIDEFNASVIASDEDQDTVIFSTDFENFYPSFDVPVVSELAAQEFMRSDLSLEVDDIELGLYVAICYGRDDLVALGLGDVTHTRVSQRGRKPGITTPEVTARSDNIEPKFVPPVRQPSDDERKQLTALALKQLILVVLQNHIFSFNKKIYKQTSGGAIGDRLTGALGAILGQVHSRRLLTILADSEAEVKFLQLYVDDGDWCMKALPPGSRFIRERNRIEIIEEEIENDRNLDQDFRTANVVKNAANSIFEFLKVKIDCPSLHDDGWMPILDIKAQVESDKIVYQFYKKALSNDRVILANSAMPNNVKQATMANEALRRLRNTSITLPWEVNMDILTQFSNDLRVSGYNVKFRTTVISSVITGFRRQCETAVNGGPPINRPRSYQREERRNKKLISRDSWFRPQYDVVGFFPTTENS